jgi:IclR family KDG regulon transcriptional repressor
MTVESAHRALQILESFGADERDLSAAQIAQRVNLPRSSVHRLLVTLRGRGFLSPGDTPRRYRLGMRLFELGCLAAGQRNLVDEAHPLLEELSTRTGETCHLVVLVDGQATHIDVVAGPGPVIKSAHLGAQVPYHSTSVGKVLTAWAPADVREEIQRQPRPRSTDYTITTLDALERELRSVQAAGYALDLEEFEVGLRGVAVPVRDYSGNVVAALGIAGPADRFAAGRLAELVAIVVGVGQLLSERLGFSARATDLYSAAAWKVPLPWPSKM